MPKMTIRNIVSFLCYRLCYLYKFIYLKLKNTTKYNLKTTGEKIIFGTVVKYMWKLCNSVVKLYTVHV